MITGVKFLSKGDPVEALAAELTVVKSGLATVVCICMSKEGLELFDEEVVVVLERDRKLWGDDVAFIEGFARNEFMILVKE